MSAVVSKADLAVPAPGTFSDCRTRNIHLTMSGTKKLPIPSILTLDNPNKNYRESLQRKVEQYAPTELTLVL